MFFHSWPFLVFFLIVYGGYLALRPTKFWGVWLLIASYVFYGWWNPWYLILIFYSTLLDYACVQCMSKSKHKSLWLTISLVNNLGLLFFYKYREFAIETVRTCADLAGYSIAAPTWDTTLPVGISFFTFQSMSYTIDYYRGRLEREPSFLRFATFVAFFPQLVAGPIERASELLPQLAKKPTIRIQDVTDGLSLFAVGLFKKLAMSNYLAAYAEPIFNVPDNYSSSHLLLAVFAFAWQIYFDFSGYTDMARGIARAMGFHLMMNFNHPYLADSFSDFWSRWHISLSTWFRDYVYIPLGGNRHGQFNTYRNLFLTMLISGVWHGANWTFVIWGLIHGIAAVTMRPFERTEFYRTKIPRFIKTLFVFVVVCVAWVYFRSLTVSDANLILYRIVTTGFADPQFPLLAIGLVGGIWIYQIVFESKWSRILDYSAVKIALFTAMIVYLLFAPGQANTPFIYFQF